MSTEPKIDTCYIDMLQKRKLHHAEERGRLFDAAWDSLTTVDMEHELLRQAQYHKGHEEAIAMIIEELVAPIIAPRLDMGEESVDEYCSKCGGKMLLNGGDDGEWLRAYYVCEDCPAEEEQS